MVLRRRPGRSDHPAAHDGVKPRPHLLADEKLPPEPRQKRSLAARERWKAAGLALFGEKGYEATSVSDIARRARLAVGGFYQHFTSKRQLLLVLMDDLLDKLSQLELRPSGSGGLRAGLHALLAGAFSRDLKYLGAYRAWQEASLSDPHLARTQAQIQAWSTGRILLLFQALHQHPAARPDVDLKGLARALDAFFWNLLAQAVHMPKPELNQWIDISTHLIFHALFLDSAAKPGEK